jgi:hypothetical protein
LTCIQHVVGSCVILETRDRSPPRQMPAQERWNRDPVADAKRSSTFSAGDALLVARVVRVRRGNTTWLQHHLPLPITRRVDSADCVERMVALPTEVSPTRRCCHVLLLSYGCSIKMPKAAAVHRTTRWHLQHAMDGPTCMYIRCRRWHRDTVGSAAYH